MSDLSTRFLRQLQSDLELLKSADCPLSQGLYKLSSRLQLVEGDRQSAVSWQAERESFIIDSAHPSIKALLDRPARRRSDVVFVISMLASSWNRAQTDITDEHERAFHQRLVRFASENLQGSW